MNGKLQLIREKPEKSQNVNKLSNTRPASSHNENMYEANGGFTSPQAKEKNLHSREHIVPDYYPSMENGVETDANSFVATETQRETIQRFLSVCLQQFVDHNQVPNGAQVSEAIKPLLILYNRSSLTEPLPT